jgi:cell division protein FtsZ
MIGNNNHENLKPRITVIGVGGAGGNAVNNMIRSNLEGVDFIAANTDAQALEQSSAGIKIQLGLGLTQGLGAGSKPETGKSAAEESRDEIEKVIKGSNMVFVTAGMGGGTGTGAAPVVAQIARDLGILTVGVITKPFMFEGAHRMRTAENGLNELQKHVDTLIIIPNQNLFRLANEQTTFADAFNMADNVLYSGVRGVTDLMIMPGLVNLDFADVKTVMSEMGKAMMGTGEAEGDNRAIEAAEAAISNPLLDEVSMRGAKGVLINITGGFDMTLYEVDEAANRIREEVENEANIIFGSTFDERLNGKIRVSVVATGIDAEKQAQAIRDADLLSTVKREALHQEPQLNLDSSQEANSFRQEESFNLRNHENEILEERLSEEKSDESASEFTPKPHNFDIGQEQSKPENYQEPAKKKSIFGIFRKKTKTEVVTDLPSSTPQQSNNLRSHSNEGSLEEDDLDIPTFLRKKKD